MFILVIDYVLWTPLRAIGGAFGMLQGLGAPRRVRLERIKRSDPFSLKTYKTINNTGARFLKSGSRRMSKVGFWKRLTIGLKKGKGWKAFTSTVGRYGVKGGIFAGLALVGAVTLMAIAKAQGEMPYHYASTRDNLGFDDSLTRAPWLDKAQLACAVGVGVCGAALPFTFGASLVPGLWLMGLGLAGNGLRYVIGGHHIWNMPDGGIWPLSNLVKWLKGGLGLEAGAPLGYRQY